MPPPKYFPLNVLMNIQGYDSIDEVLSRGLHSMSPEAFETAANETGAIILDTREPQTFAKGFIPNSINIGVDGQFAPWVGALIPDIKQEILIVCEPGREEIASLILAALREVSNGGCARHRSAISALARTISAYVPSPS